MGDWDMMCVGLRVLNSRFRDCVFFSVILHKGKEDTRNYKHTFVKLISKACTSFLQVEKRCLKIYLRGCLRWRYISWAETDVIDCKFVIKLIMKASSIFINIWSLDITSVSGINMRMKLQYIISNAWKKIQKPNPEIVSSSCLYHSNSLFW